MKPPSQILLEKIEASGLGWVATENAFVGHEPEEPIECLTAYDSEGWVQNPRLNYDMDHVQFRVRSASYLTAYKKIKEIKLLLNGISSFNSGDDRVEGIWVQVPPMPIGRDNKNNFIFVLTLRVLTIRSEKGNRQ